MPGGRTGENSDHGIEPQQVKGYTLDLTEDLESDPGRLKMYASDLNTLEGRMTGRSHDLDGSHNDAAQSFTELFKWPITEESSKDLGHWADTTRAIFICSALTEELADAVEYYKDERTRIISRWNSEAPYVLDIEDPIDQVTADNPIGDVTEGITDHSGLSSLKSELEEEERVLKTTSVETIEEIAGNIRDGETPDVLSRLYSGGYINFGYFNLGGDIESGVPIDIDRDEFSENLLEYFNGNKEPDDDFYEMIAVLSNLGFRAGSAQNNDGVEMESTDMEFLKEVFDEIEDEVPVVRLAEIAPEHLSKDDAAAFLGALGGGILALSDRNLRHGDESVPGGYYDVPLSVRQAIEGNEDFGGVPEYDWVALENLFGHVPEDIEGGRGFSLTMGLTVGHELKDEDVYSVDEKVESMQAILDVATRNHSANSDMISGPGDWYQHPGIEDAHEQRNRHGALEAILTQEWIDNGDAASGYTDWFLEARESAENTEEIDRVAGDFIEFLTEEERYDRLTGLTGGIYSGAFGQDGLSFTQVNPEIANGLADMFGAYVHEFSLPYDGEGVGTAEHTGEMVIGRDERLRFLEYVAGGPEAATAMVAISEMHSQNIVDDIFSGDVPANGAGERVSELDDLIDDALLNEARSRMDSGDNFEEEVAERRKAGRAAVIDLLFKPGESISSSNPITQASIGQILSGANDILTKIATEDLDVDLGPVPDENATIDDSVVSARATVGSAIIDHYIENEEIDPSDLDEHEHLEFSNGKVRVVGIDSTNRFEVENDIESLLGGVDDGRGQGVLEDFIQRYHEHKTDQLGNENVDEERRDPEEE